MTKQEAIAAHRKMWRWIADETERRECVVIKTDYLDAMGIPEKDVPHAGCYCCDYGLRSGGVGNCCASCPIKWPGGCCVGDGLYGQWANTYEHNNWIAAAEIARRIAELPEREDVR